MSSCIFDPGSNTHVTNTRAYGWKKRADGTGKVVKAGNQELVIQEWGDVVLLTNTPTGTEQIELTYVAYVPGFLTNVVGLSRCRSIAIHFDSGQDCLYQRKWNNVVSKLSIRESSLADRRRRHGAAGRWSFACRLDSCPQEAFVRAAEAATAYTRRGDHWLLHDYDTSNGTTTSSTKRTIKGRNFTMSPPDSEPLKPSLNTYVQ
jgi:hypothetical protein